MRPQTAIITLLLVMPYFVSAQSTGKLTGKIQSATDKQLLEGATISALNAQSGIFIKHTVSNKNGEFQLTGVPLNDSVNLIVSFTGFRDTTAVYLLTTEKRTTNTGDWKLHPGDELEQVTITARKAPFVIKKDTIEFNATAFKSLPADMVRELLRKLPGIVMDEQGNVTVNGKKVNKIKVDGRDFFNGNLKMAAENLPAGIIDKVKVYETREHGEQYNSVVEPGDKDLTLDLSLKKENRKGVFGHAGTGYGTEERWNAGVFVNAFNEGRRYSIFGNTGNLPGNADPLQTMLISGTGGQDGILKNASGAGININNELGNKGRIDIGYITSHNSRANTTDIERTNLLPDSSFLYNSNATSETKNTSHELKANISLTKDTLETINLMPQISYSENALNSTTSAASTTMNHGLINSQQNSNLTNERSWNVSNGFNYNRRTADGKTNLTFNWNVNLRQGRGDQQNRSLNSFYDSGTGRTDSLNQRGKNRLNGLSNMASLNIYRHFSEKLIGIINYTFSHNNDNYDKDVFNYNNSTGKHDITDSLFSIHNRSQNISHLPSASIGYKSAKFAAEIGAGIRLGRQDNNIVWKDSTVTVKQQNFSPRVSISYALNKNSRVTANYSLHGEQPSAEQLAPVQDNTNPLYIKIGNPFLRSAISHQFNSEISYYSSNYRWYTSMRGSGSVTGSQIVEDAYYEADGRQVSTWRNVNGIKQFNIDWRAGSRLRFSDYQVHFEVATGINTGRTAGFVNRQQNNSSTVQFNPQVNVGVNLKSIFTLQMNAGIDINATTYSLEGLEDVDYNTKRIMVFSTFAPVKRLNISTSVFHYYNSQLPDNFQRARTLLNSSIAYTFLKNERLSVGVGVNDILNNNISVTRTVSPTALETRQVNALRRYGMLTVNYRLSNFRGAAMF